MSARDNESTVRRIYDELWNERRLEVAGELIAEGATNYGTTRPDEPKNDNGSEE